MNPSTEAGKLGNYVIMGLLLALDLLDDKRTHSLKASFNLNYSKGQTSSLKRQIKTEQNRSLALSIHIGHSALHPR